MKRPRRIKLVERKGCKSFTVTTGLDTEWMVKVFVWKTKAQLFKAYGEPNAAPDFAAFCAQFKAADICKREDGADPIAAEMHFYEGENLEHGIIAHETYHAAEAIRLLCKFRPDRSVDMEEVFARITQTITTATVAKLKELGLRVH